MLHLQFSKFFLFIFLLLCSVTQAQNLTPGIWQAKSEVILDGVSILPAFGEECISLEQAQNPKATISKIIEKIGCVLTSWSIKDGNLDASLDCRTNQLRATGKIRGQFSEKSYDLHGNAQGVYLNFIPASANLILRGQWMSECDSVAQIP